MEENSMVCLNLHLLARYLGVKGILANKSRMVTTCETPFHRLRRSFGTVQNRAYLPLVPDSVQDRPDPCSEFLARKNPGTELVSRAGSDPNDVTNLPQRNLSNVTPKKSEYLRYSQTIYFLNQDFDHLFNISIQRLWGFKILIQVYRPDSSCYKTWILI